MPKVRDSSGTIGTTRFPIFLSRSSALRMRTNDMVVEISRPAVLLSWASNAVSGGISSAADFLRRVGKLPPSAARGELQERNLMEPFIRDRQAETVAKLFERSLAHFLLLVGDILAFPGLTHAITLHCLGQNDCRLAFVLQCGCVCR